MLIAQVTDIHIGFEPDNPAEPNLTRFEALLDHLLHGPNRPDLLLLTGDLTESGEPRHYAALASRLAACPFPVWPIPGNHDLRRPLLEAFPQARTIPGGFIQYAVELDGLRLLMLDTLLDGRHGGGFCETRARWLADTLAQRPDVPTLLALHHPPFDVGIDWMDLGPERGWVDRLAGAIAGHSQVLGIITGHIHRAVGTGWAGLPAFICGSSAPAVTLQLSPTDPERPDGRTLIGDEPPAFALHWWNGTRLTSHLLPLTDASPLARFDDKLQPMLRAALAKTW